MALASSFRTGNPTLGERAFQGLASADVAEKRMTVQGTVNKTGILLLVTFAAASLTWKMFYDALAGSAGSAQSLMPLLYGGAIAGLVLAVITSFKREWAPVTAPLYCVAEGLFLGGISGIFGFLYQGIVWQAVGLTFGTLAALLIVYRLRIVQATENFKLGVMAATGGIALLYIGELVANLAFGAQIPYIHQSGPIGIGFSLVVIVIAALNLVLDFDFIERGAEQGAPKYMEWYGAFGLMVTLVWLYLEFLRLLAKLRSR